MCGWGEIVFLPMRRSLTTARKQLIPKEKKDRREREEGKLITFNRFPLTESPPPRRKNRVKQEQWGILEPTLNFLMPSPPFTTLHHLTLICLFLVTCCSLGVDETREKYKMSNNLSAHKTVNSVSHKSTTYVRPNHSVGLLSRVVSLLQSLAEIILLLLVALNIRTPMRLKRPRRLAAAPMTDDDSVCAEPVSPAARAASKRAMSVPTSFQ